MPKLIVGKDYGINISIDGKYGSAIDIGSGNKEITSEENIRAIELENGYGFYDGATRLSFKGYIWWGTIPCATLSVENSIKLAVTSNGGQYVANAAMRAVYMRDPVKAPPPRYNAYEKREEPNEPTNTESTPTDHHASYSIINVSRKSGGATVTVSPTRKDATFAQTYGSDGATVSVTLSLKGRDPEKFAVYRDDVKVDDAYYKDGRMHFPIDAFGEYTIVYEE